MSDPREATVRRAHPRSALRGFAVALTAAALAGCGGVPQSASPVASSTTALATSVPATNSPVPSPAAIPPWEQLTTITVPRSVVGIAASPAGYVVVSLPRTAWFSVDGRSWTSTDLPFRPATSMNVEVVTGLDDGTELEATVNAVVGGPNGFLAVGSYTLPPCSSGPMAPGGPPRCEIAPISWTSSDGRSWRSSITTQIPADGPALPRYSELARAWPSAGGWDAAVSVLRDTPVSRGNTLLHSSDGLRWSRLEPAPLPDGATSGDDVFEHAGSTADDGRRLTWQVINGTGMPETALSTSTDGTAWARLAGFDGAGAFVTHGLGPELGGGGWLLAGFLQAGDASPWWWYSEDLTTWRSGALPGPWASSGGPGAVARWAGRYVAVGDRINTCCPTKTVTAVSKDGTTWLDTGAVEGPLYLAGGPAGLVGVGHDEEQEATIWRAADPTP